MTIDEAIKTLNQEYNFKLILNLTKEANAIKLGIEALHFVDDARNVTAPFLARLLKGETEE